MITIVVTALLGEVSVSAGPGGVMNGITLDYFVIVHLPMCCASQVNVWLLVHTDNGLLKMLNT